MKRHRIEVTLEDSHAERLRALAGRAGVEEETLARWLLARALDEVDADQNEIAVMLDGIDGAFERAQHGAVEARAGRTLPLNGL